MSLPRRCNVCITIASTAQPREEVQVTEAHHQRNCHSHRVVPANTSVYGWRRGEVTVETGMWQAPGPGTCAFAHAHDSAQRTRWQNAAGGQSVVPSGSLPGSSNADLRRSIQVAAASVAASSNTEVAAAGLSRTTALRRFGRRCLSGSVPSAVVQLQLCRSARC